MAWWNTPSQVAAPPLTTERLEAGLIRLGLTAERTSGLADAVDLLSERYPVRLALASGWLVLRASYPWVLPGETAPALVEAALAANARILWPDLRVSTDDAQVHLTATVRVPVAVGLSDAQLSEVLRQGLGCLLGGLDMLAEDLGLPGPSTQGAPSEGAAPTVPGGHRPPGVG